MEESVILINQVGIKGHNMSGFIFNWKSSQFELLPALESCLKSSSS